MGASYFFYAVVGPFLYFLLLFLFLKDLILIRKLVAHLLVWLQVVGQLRCYHWYVLELRCRELGVKPRVFEIWWYDVNVDDDAVALDAPNGVDSNYVAVIADKDTNRRVFATKTGYVVGSSITLLMMRSFLKSRMVGRSKI